MCHEPRFVPQHIRALGRCLDPVEAWAGNRLRRYHEQVDGYFQSNLPEGIINRNQLKALCADGAYSTRECVAAILAWGGMNRRHARNLFTNYEAIERTAEDLRSGQMNPDEAYRSFKNVTDEIRMGIGPAYYTKLIFFLEPTHTGYIMDQWTGKSINLLRGEKIVLLTAKGLVKPENSVAQYRTFRSSILLLARHFNTSAENIEMSIFSIGGHQKGAWRRHVIDHWGD